LLRLSKFTDDMAFVVECAEFIERSPDGHHVFNAVLRGFEDTGTSSQFPDFFPRFLAALKEIEPGPSRKPSNYNAPCGPEERWGYTGPVTSRLPEREWWPLRHRILERDSHTCNYCGAQDERMCADHVVPLSRGGSNDESNLVACCLPCNSSKADRLLDEWEGRRTA
jgi:5-methylcytosine-specific restriction endonuclease McrA